MKVSVITVCYNSEKTIERTVQSVISQSYPEIEYIIIDGNSSDQTLNILKKYSTFIKYLVSEDDLGIYDAMNKGLQKASGDIICFLNSDDIYASENVIQNVVYRMQIENLEAFFGGVVFFRGNNPDRIVRTYRYSNFNLNMFASGWMPAHPSTFLCNSLIQKNGLFNCDFKIAGDFDYLLRLFKNYNFKYACTDNILVKMQSGGISNKNLNSKFLLNKEIYYSCKKHEIDTNFLKIYMRYLKKILEYLI